MEPRFQYAQTEDGVSIAFTTLGEGAPVVLMPVLPFGNFMLQWEQNPVVTALTTSNRMVVLYDNRGAGLSDREVTDFSLDAHLRDLRAVVERLGLRQFALMGRHESTPVAIAFAARATEQVSHLVLWAAWSSASDVWSGARYPALQALRLTGDWELYTDTLAALLGLPTHEETVAAAASLRETVTEKVATAFWEASKQFDVTALLPEVMAPTLVVHPSEVSWLPVENARRLTSRLPNARLTILKGGVMPLGEVAEALATATNDFLSDGAEAAPSVPTRDAGAFRTILFTDVEGSTALADRLGDAKARELLREHDRVLREALKAHGGSEVKTTGDGFMASFSSATKALECAIAIQSVFAERNQSAKEEIRVRCGLNAGEPIAEDDPGGRGDLFGTAVNMAARIAAKAEGGEILASNVVRELVAGKGFMFGDRGETALRGFDHPVRLFEVRWHD